MAHAYILAVSFVCYLNLILFCVSHFPDNYSQEKNEKEKRREALSKN